MKKLFYLFFAIGIVLSACNSMPENEVSNEKYELQDELQKKFMAVKVIKVYSKNAIDGFGNPILEDRWYGISNRTKSFFPISWAYSMGSFDFDSRHDLFYPDLKIHLEKTRVVAFNSLSTGTPVDVEILLLGSKNLIFLNSMESSGEIKVRIK